LVNGISVIFVCSFIGRKAFPGGCQAAVIAETGTDGGARGAGEEQNAKIIQAADGDGGGSGEKLMFAVNRATAFVLGGRPT
jgi:hypothetical protein